MDYEKKYKEALGWMQSLYNGLHGAAKEDAEHYFPELKESEDEKIRKTLIDYFNTCHGDYYGELKRKDILAWLEKQGEQKPTDKVEPKFHEGEWIVWKDKCYKVNYNGCGYELVDQDGLSTSLEYGTINEGAHLWSIQDAKDGDVLATNSNIIFIFKYLDEGGTIAFRTSCTKNSGVYFPKLKERLCDQDVYPAIKEQCDLLFQKMKEAGYEWDSKKKELKKINSYCQENCKGFQETGKCFADGECKAKREAEQEPTDEEIKTLLRTEYEKGRADAIAKMQNPAWSEEDECYMSECIGAIATKDGWSFEEKRKTKHWLKSLKERVLPQPKQEWSEEDERTYKSITYSFVHNYPLTIQQQEFVKSLKQRIGG